MRAAQNGAGTPTAQSAPPIAGQNTGSLNTTTTASLTPGISINYTDPNLKANIDREWNVTLEKQMRGGNAVRVSYMGNHGSKLLQQWEYNSSPSAYVWYVATGTATPTGTYANTAMRPWDTKVYGAISGQQSTGWSNSNQFQVEVQHQYSRGYAFQAFYVLNNAFWTANNTSSTPSSSMGADIQGYNQYVAGLVPKDDKTRNRFEMYSRNTTIPKHRVRFNWVVDLPVGHGKRFLGNSNQLVDTLVGGWQIAGDGTIWANYIQPSLSYWGTTSPTQNWKRKYKIRDCRGGSGVCYNAYMGFNGYIPATKRNTSGGVIGLPSNYTPAFQPIIPIPADGGSKTDPLYSYYDTNTVWVKLNNGSTIATTYNPGPTGVNPYSKTYLMGPFNWIADGSLYKAFRLGHEMKLRVDADAFNLFNNQGTNNPDNTTGIISTQTSKNTARQLQLSARLTW